MVRGIDSRYVSVANHITYIYIYSSIDRNVLITVGPMVTVIGATGRSHAGEIP